MKNLLLAFNIILAAAVAFLFVKVYSKPGSKTNKTNATKIDSLGNGKAFNIAYIELDSLNEQIKYIKNKRTQLEAEQKAIETEWQNGYRGLENKKNDFMKRGNAITQQEAEKMQGELMQQQQQIDGKKQSLTQALSEKSYKFLDDIQKKLKDYLKEYNKDQKYQYILTTGTGMDYLIYKDESANITNDVIKGMNEVLK
jgi:outer membrane protein